MMGIEKNLLKNFKDELNDYLKEHKYKEALAVFEDSTHETVIQKSSWDIVQVVSSYLTAENAKLHKELIDCCQSILIVLAEKSDASEIVLELLEQVEGPDDVIKFCVILKALAKCLNRISDKTKAAEWCINTIRSYIDDLSMSMQEKLSESKSSECDDNVLYKIQTIYPVIIDFLEPLVEEAALEKHNSEKYFILRDHLLSILIFLMGNPLCQIQDEEELQTDLKFISEKIVILTTRITGDLLWCLNIIDIRSKRENSMKKTNTDEGCPNLKVTLFELPENIPDLAYANFYFHVLTKPALWERVPQIYHPEYIFHSCVYFILKLLQDNGTVPKGLNLMHHLMKKMNKRCLPPAILEVNIYCELFDMIIKVMIYNNNDKQRKKALHVFQEYNELYNIQAKYFVIQRLYQTSQHSGLVGLTTGILKSSIIECLDTVPPIPDFLGDHLKPLLKHAFNLPHGSASDLVETSDEVITSLNLLRFLLIRDQRNETGIWSMIDDLKKDYLKPLRDAISQNKAYWVVKIKDLEEQKKINTKKYGSVALEKRDTEISLTVGGEELPPMPVSQKIAFCNQTVNGLDVMESILIRINECIAEHLIKQDG